MKRIFLVFILLSALWIMNPGAANALIPVGGINLAYLVPCTCGPGYMVVTSLGTMWIPPWTVFWVGSGFPVANFLAWVSPGGGCSMNAFLGCWYWPAQFTTVFYGGSN